MDYCMTGWGTLCGRNLHGHPSYLVAAVLDLAGPMQHQDRQYGAACRCRCAKLRPRLWPSEIHISDAFAFPLQLHSLILTFFLLAY